MDAVYHRPVVGEIVVRGANIMKNYWKDPELTAKALRGGWMHNGDLAEVDEYGFIYMVDRENDMIIRWGENTYHFVRERIAGYKTPTRVAFMEGIPKTPIGKILRREVREMLSETQAGER